jgi:hypothetical protein
MNQQDQSQEYIQMLASPQQNLEEKEKIYETRRNRNPRETEQDGTKEENEEGKTQRTLRE